MKAAIAASEVSPSAGSKVVSFLRMSFAPFLCQPLCPLDVPGLAALVAAAEQDDHRVATLPKVHAVTGTVVDAELADPRTHPNDIASVSVREPFQSCKD